MSKHSKLIETFVRHELNLSSLVSSVNVIKLFFLLRLFVRTDIKLLGIVNRSKDNLIMII